ncbi:5'-methylthioadenosine/S-adenosylhomocysteine nucleosidase family protein [Clostridium luticellarii]|uniref:Futalosine hydrolase n=1 Tax=Clostridium luticellarii TaxID=1691940 RepID=A0A2T0BN58_9CLOT|nr:hypothetical protein [Clostridium luticellarii]MCI1967421.1 hypothetical protein [Clostridium luticellarii]PRR85315.1 Futalosine hydrolase [Clostridium luticellarii]
MIFISTALYSEAEPFIKRFSLKKYNSINKFEVFKNDEILLIISKTGAVNAASACSYIIGKFDVTAYDTFINIGLCESVNGKFKAGAVVLCNKIINGETGMDFYPDMIFKHPFEEGCLDSFSRASGKESPESIKGDIADVEGAAFFESVSIFLPPHRIYCLKIVAGYLGIGNLEPAKADSLVEKNSVEICKWILDISHECAKPIDILDEKDMNYINEIILNLNLSVSMQQKLKKLCRSYKIRQDSLILALEPFTQIYCKTKQERKIYFEKLVQQLKFI